VIKLSCPNWDKERVKVRIARRFAILLMALGAVFFVLFILDALGIGSKYQVEMTAQVFFVIATSCVGFSGLILFAIRPPRDDEDKKR
jgi:hypothetical protein